MARPLRIEYPGAFYHITARGNERKAIFKSKRDREQFLSYLESAYERYGAIVHCYCLMDNHYHLLLETPEANLSKILHHVNASYTTYFNTKRKRSGHLFQGRYKAILVDKDTYAVELSRYIHLNPVWAGLKESLEDPLLSSLYAYLNPRKKPPFVATSFVLSYFGKTEKNRIRKYRAFVLEGLEKELESPLKKTVASTILGEKSFIVWVQTTFLEGVKDREIPALKELAARPSIDEIREATEALLGKDSRESKKVALYLAHVCSGRSLKEIACSFGTIGPSAVSQNARRMKQRLQEDKNLRKITQQIESKIMEKK